MAKQKRSFLIIFLIGAASCLTASVDNRFVPFLPKPYIKVEGRPSYVRIDPFFTTADKGFGEYENEIGLPELYGRYDQGKIAQALVALGDMTPIYLEMSCDGVKIPWIVDGKIQAQGLMCNYHQFITDWLFLGLNGFFMRVNSRQAFKFEDKDLDKSRLDELRRQMHQALGLSGNYSDRIGLGDIDIYMRIGNIWEYVFKFRKIDAGIKIGLLIPSGLKRNEHCPPSIPFGGDGHWGLYANAEAEFELKEDWNFGIVLGVSKRFKKVQERRMSISDEPRIYGGIIGPAEIDPGSTFLLSPYFSIENLREGLGFRVQYTLRYHEEDRWRDVRHDKTIPVKLAQIQRLSSWISHYATLHAFYDFGKERTEHGCYPIVLFSWDIPATIFSSRQTSKTHKISLGIEFNF